MSDPLLDAARLMVGRPPCVELTWSVLRRAYRREWRTGGLAYRELWIIDPERPWSPMDAAVRELRAELVDAPVPGRWHLVQGWRVLDSGPAVPRQGPVPNGHAWLWYALTPERGMALESSETRGIRWPRGDDCTGEPWAARIQPYAAGVRLAVLPHIVS